MADENLLGGLPAEPWLSGLPLGGLGTPQLQQSFSGEASSLLGMPQGAMQQQGPEGLSEAEIAALLGSIAPGPGTSGSLYAPIGGTVGNPNYSLAGGAQSLPSGSAQTQGGYMQAGQMSPQQESDPLSVIRQALGFVQKGAGLYSALDRASGQQAPSTASGYSAGGTAPNDQIDATGYSLFPEAQIADPTRALIEAAGSDPFGGGAGQLNNIPDMTLMQKGLLDGSLDTNFLQGLSAPDQATFLKAMMSGEVDPNNLNPRDFNFGEGEGAGGYNASGGSLLGGALGAGSALSGLYGLIGAEGDPKALLGGGIKTLSGLNQTLQSFPELSNALGIGTDAISGVGGALGGAGGLLGVAGGIQGLMADPENPMGYVNTLNSLLQAYSAIQALTGVGGAAAGATAGAAGAGAAAGAEAGAAGGLGAVSAAAGPIGAVLAIGMIVDMLARKHPSLSDRIYNRNVGAASGWQNAFLDAAQGGDAGSLLGLAGMGDQIGHGNVQFYSPRYGFGGDYNDPMSPTFQEALKGAVMSPEGLGNFLTDLQIKSGVGGQAAYNPMLTDYYRRELAGRAGLAEGSFGPLDQIANPFGGQGGFGAQSIFDRIMQQSGMGNDVTNPTYLAAKELESGGPLTNWDIMSVGRHSVGVPILNMMTHMPISQYYRKPGELSLDEAKTAQLHIAMEKIRAIRKADVARREAERYGLPYQDAGGDGGAGAP